MVPLKPALLCLVAAGLAAAATTDAAAQPGGNPIVVIDTSVGAVTVELYADKAPVTVKNFLDYVDAKHYDGTIFHRVMDGFMVQGGGFDAATKKEKVTKAGIRNEAKNGVSNRRGTLAMARTNDPNSATAQFFINVVDNDKLNPGGVSPDGYAVFGRVTEGMGVVDQIKGVRTGRVELGAYDDRTKEWTFVPMENVPLEPVTIKSVRRADKK